MSGIKRRIIIKRGEGNYANQFYAVILADNGEPLAHTEHRARKSALKKTMKKYFLGFKIDDQC
jgi:hypothetical protein